MSTTTWIEQAEAALTAAGRKRGGARRAVLELLGAEHCALSAQEIEDAVAQVWRTNAGTVCVVWPLPGCFEGPPPHRVAAQPRYADALVHVQSDFGNFGPRLSTAQPGNLTARNNSGMAWANLARVLGQPAPYWPYMLRIPSLIVAWKPGTPPETYLTLPEVGTTPLLPLAATPPRPNNGRGRCTGRAPRPRWAIPASDRSSTSSRTADAPGS